MKNLVVLEEHEAIRIKYLIERTDVEIGSMINRGFPKNIKQFEMERLENMNKYVHELGILLEVWDA